MENLANRDASSALLTVKAALIVADQPTPSGMPSQTSVVIVDFYNDQTRLGALRKQALIVIDGEVGSTRPVIGRAIRFSKRVVRRLMRWYIKPPFQQQSAVNLALINALQQLQVQNDELKTELILLKNQVNGVAQ